MTHSVLGIVCDFLRVRVTAEKNFVVLNSISHQFAWVGWIRNFSGGRRTSGEHSRCCPMSMNEIACVTYFSSFKLKMIQSPDRGLTRTSELESSAHAPLRHMILFLRSSLSPEQRSGNVRATIAYSLIEWGDNRVQKMEPTWGVRLIKAFLN